MVCSSSLNDNPINKKISFEDLPQDLKDIVVGLALGDLYIRRRLLNSNATLNFKASSKNEPYILHLYSIFQAYCKSKPRIRFDTTIKGKKYYAISFDTLAYPAFNVFHSMFYKRTVNVSSGKIDTTKIVPSNIAELLTPRGLAYWFIDDGGAEGSGYKLYTNCFTENEVILLKDALFKKFGINCSIHTRIVKKQAYILYIKADSRDKFQKLVYPYIIPHFLYKLNLRGQH